MPPAGPRRVRRVLSTGLLLLAGLLVVPAVPAQASAVTVCETDPVRAAARTSQPGEQVAHDHAAVPASVRRSVQRVLDGTSVPDGERVLRRSAAESSEPSEPVVVRVRVRVHVHVVDGARAGDVRGPGRRAVRRQLRVLDDAFAGGQARRAAGSPFRFRLGSFERVQQTRWHRARLGSRAERRMWRTLHVGGRDELNLYLTEPRAAAGGVDGVALGHATYPWDSRTRPRLDGVVVHTATLPGRGSPAAPGYARGDSAVHEVGHWLGLLHTFEGGCGRLGDMVDDTPAEAAPTYGCEKGRDTCPTSSGRDSVRNFMNYSPDDCMDRFTRGQVDRMARTWLAYRSQ